MINLITAVVVTAVVVGLVSTYIVPIFWKPKK